MQQIQHNDPCSCGSGKKYKKCCMNADENNRFLGQNFVKRNYIYITLIAIFFLGIFLRYYGFHQPHGLTFDEGLYSGLLAQQLKEDPTDYSTQSSYQFFTAEGEKLPEYLNRPLFKHPPVYCYLIALGYSFFGSNNLTAVSVSILFGSLMILVVFFLGKALYDHRVGLLAAFFLCIEPVHWVCSERIWMETTLSFFMLLALFLFVLGQKQKYYLLFSGLSAGLAMLTKYPGALVLFIIISFVVLVDRAFLKQKFFWSLFFLAFLLFSPWIIWNWRVYGDFGNSVFSGHQIGLHWDNVVRIFTGNKGMVVAFFSLIGLALIMHRKIGLFLDKASTEQRTSKRKRVVGWICFTIIVLAVTVLPFLREMVKEAFVWKDTILVEWWNPFSKGPWHFYLTRLAELSPLYLFSFVSVFLFLGKDKGDKLLVWSSLCILGAFILIGNYQSRYILPAVPLLIVLSARLQVLIYDKLSLNQAASGEVSNFRTYRFILKILFGGVCLYFVLKTLRTDWLIAIGPDFGYF